MAQYTDVDLESSVANMLKFGVSLAALMVFAGAVMLLRHAGAELPNFGHFHGEAAALCSPGAIVRGAVHLDPLSVIQCGLLVLIATPVVRVAFCVGGFARQRNFLYVIISLIVLAVLIYSLTKGAV